MKQKRNEIDKLKLLFVVPQLHGGGAERKVLEIINSLDYNKFEVDIVVWQRGRMYEKLRKGVNLYSYNYRNHKHNFAYFYEFLKIILKGFFLFRKYDLIISWIELFPTYLSFISAFLRHKKIIGVIHIVLSDWIKIMNAYKGHWFLIPKIYNKLDRVICVSNAVKEDLIKNFKINPSKIKVIYNPVNIEYINSLKKEEPVDFKFDENKDYILGIGRIDQQKGFDILIKAFEILCNVNERVELIILGRGKDEEILKEYTKKVNIADKVHFCGFKENPFSFLYRSTIFVSSSRVEGLSSVLLEAMACGIPIIGTDIPATREILENGEYGIIVPVNSPEKLAKAMKRLLEDKELQDKFRKAGYKRLLDFNKDRIVKEYEQLFIEVYKD